MYVVLSEEDQDEIIVAFILAQERDEFCHSINLERYDRMLATLEDGPWKKRVTKLRDETRERLAEVRSIIDATRDQLPPGPRIEQAKARIKAKEQPTR